MVVRFKIVYITQTQSPKWPIQPSRTLAERIKMDYGDFGNGKKFHLVNQSKVA